MRPSQPVNLIVCSITMRFDAARLPQALELLCSAPGPTRAKSGCCTCRVGDELAEGGTVVYTEEWDSATAFERHVQSEEFWRVLVALDMCAEEPEVVIGDLNAIRGMEYLRKLRRDSSSSPGHSAKSGPRP